MKASICKTCERLTYRKGGICSTCKPIRVRNQQGRNWTPKGTLATLAAGNRPKERPVFESEPVNISEFGVGYIGTGWGDFNFSSAKREEIDNYNKEQALHELNRKAIYQKHREGRAGRTWTNTASYLKRGNQ